VPSSVPRATDALEQFLRDTMPAGVHVQYERPLTLPASYERAYVVTESDYVRQRASAFTTERYTLRVLFEVYGAGDDPKAVRDRCWELIDLFDAALGEDLDGETEDAGVERVDTDSGPTDEGWVFQAVVSLPATERF
jgi:hypothetical protein